MCWRQRTCKHVDRRDEGLRAIRGEKRRNRAATRECEREERRALSRALELRELGLDVVLERRGRHLGEQLPCRGSAAFFLSPFLEHARLIVERAIAVEVAASSARAPYTAVSASSSLLLLLAQAEPFARAAASARTSPFKNFL